MTSSRTGWSERVRDLARVEYVDPARGTRELVTIPFGEFKAKLVRLGFPQGHANQVVTPLETPKFWRPLGLELCSPRGQARTIDSKLVFRFTGEGAVSSTIEERTRRGLEAFDRMRGLMKKEIAAFGGSEAFIRWVRSEEDGPAV